MNRYSASIGHISPPREDETPYDLGEFDAKNADHCHEQAAAIVDKLDQQAKDDPGKRAPSGTIQVRPVRVPAPDAAEIAAA